MSAGGMNAGGLTRRAAASTIGDLFSTAARLYPARVAAEDAVVRRGFAELDARANRTAAVLSKFDPRGLRRFAVLSENRVEYLEVQLAAAKLGAVIACLNWRLAPGELRSCVELIEPVAIVASERYLQKLDRGNTPLLTFGTDWERRLAAMEDTPPGVRVDPEQPWLVLYTGGTTGVPKGAMLSHRAEIARMGVMPLDLDLRPGDASLAWSPLFHMGGAEPALFSLLTGGRVVIEDGFDADRIAAHLARERFGWVSLMPGATGALIVALERLDARPNGLRACGVMADLVPAADLARLTTLLGAPWCNTFGSTETGTPPLSAGRIAIGDAAPDLAKTPSPLTEIRLLNEDGHEVADGDVGELAMRGPTLFSGYWRDEAATERDFRNGWFHMGDLFRRRADGRFEFVDRAKYLIKSGGENIYPAEIERVLLADAGVADAVVVRRRDARWGEVPVALVVARESSLDPARLAAACRAALAGYKQPKQILLVPPERLARTPTGKVPRQALEAWVTHSEGAMDRSSAL
jgi:acyl-CoA synthetase (AMP-forming)/AMP-acid ligase II